MLLREDECYVMELSNSFNMLLGICSGDYHDIYKKMSTIECTMLVAS